MNYKLNHHFASKVRAVMAYHYASTGRAATTSFRYSRVNVQLGALCSDAAAHMFTNFCLSVISIFLRRSGTGFCRKFFLIRNLIILSVFSESLLKKTHISTPSSKSSSTSCSFIRCFMKVRLCLIISCFSGQQGQKKAPSFLGRMVRFFSFRCVC
jgi:hypothetical protein